VGKAAAEVCSFAHCSVPLAPHAEKHPRDQADERCEAKQQKTAQRQRYRALLLRLGSGDAECGDKALYQENQQFHRSLDSYDRLGFVLSDPETPPNPARDALEEPPLDAEDLEKEIGDSDTWDEASEDPDNP
jgi:hypothetical protein